MFENVLLSMTSLVKGMKLLGLDYDSNENQHDALELLSVDVAKVKSLTKEHVR